MLSDDYKAVFDRQNASVGRVLADLARFCRARKTTAVVSSAADGSNATVDPLATMLAEGRREVYIRIAKMLRMDEGQIDKLVSDHERTGWDE